MKCLISYLWQLPQNILGILFLLFLRGEERHSLGGIDFYYAKGFAGGISLGKYIILGEYYKEDVKHEYGHSIQSRYLGWLYLIVIGLPSLLWAIMYGRAIRLSYNGYYKFYTEKWADKLGGVNR